MKCHRLPQVYCFAVLLASLCVGSAATAQQDAPADKKADRPDVAKISSSQLGETRNVHVAGDLFLAGQFTEEDGTVLKKNGIRRVITLRTDGEVKWDEKELIEQLGMEFVEVPFRSPDSLTDDVFDRVCVLLRDNSGKTLLHCGSANRVGAVWLAHRVLTEGVTLEKALPEARQIGMRTPAYEERAVAYIKKKLAAKTQPDSRSEKSVRPGINEKFLDPELDPGEWVERFEIESREVYGARMEVLKACGIQDGWRIADIGAGTGIYTRLFSDAAGSKGWVYAVEIAPRFLEHIQRQSRALKQQNVTGILCPEDSVSLPPESIDMAFICDTYHHFEFPGSTVASIHRALRPGGQLVLIDFERIPGKSRDWIIGHVRAGKSVFCSEIEQVGFELVEEVEIPGFEENYYLKFRKK